MPNAKWYAEWVRMIPASTPEGKKRNLEAANFIEKLAAENEALKKQIPHWTNVRDGLPKEKGDYIVNCHHEASNRVRDHVTIIHFRGKTKWATCNECISHWMPKPEPPKEVQ